VNHLHPAKECSNLFHGCASLDVPLGWANIACNPNTFRTENGPTALRLYTDWITVQPAEEMTDLELNVKILPQSGQRTHP
jgi:hypothetical protein